jgi:hypothetical protein
MNDCDSEVALMECQIDFEINLKRLLLALVFRLFLLFLLFLLFVLLIGLGAFSHTVRFARRRLSLCLLAWRVAASTFRSQLVTTIAAATALFSGSPHVLTSSCARSSVPPPTARMSCFLTMWVGSHRLSLPPATQSY